MPFENVNIDALKFNGPDGLLQSLKIAKAPVSWYDNWEPAVTSFSSEKINFLKDDYIEEANSIFKLSEEMMEAFYNALSLIRSRSDLITLAWLWHYILFINKNKVESNWREWPCPEALMGSSAGMFPAVILASDLPQIMAFYHKKNISENVLFDTLRDLRICLVDYHTETGVWGVGTYLMRWLLNHFYGRVFQFERLNFMLGRFNFNIRVFLNINGGKVIAMSEEGVKYRGDGHVDGTNNVFDSKGVWKSEIIEDADFIRGNLISPRGYAICEKVKLSKKEWRQILSNGDTVLEVHIPTGGKLTYEICFKSYMLALEFFPKYFPEKPFRALNCWSWLLAPQLQLLLPETSNIVVFQRNFFLYPVFSDDYQVYECVFSNRKVEASKLPKDTFLQQTIRDYLMSGRHLHAGGGFILVDDLYHGPGYYEKMERICNSCESGFFLSSDKLLDETKEGYFLWED